MKLGRRKKLGSFPYVSVVFSITLALFLIGLFGLLILHSNRLKSKIRENVTMQVYLDKSSVENDKIRIQKLLSEKNYIVHVEGQPDIEFVSKEDAAKIFTENTGEDFVEFLGDNPLRDAFVIKIDPAYQQLDSLKSIESQISEIESVFEVVYVENLVQTINKNIAKISIALIAFTLILLVTIVVLIDNTIRLALFSQRFLIRSMQLVGAKATFIMRPFIRRAGFHGLISGLIASLLLYGILRYFYSVVEELNQLSTMMEIATMLGVLVLFGAILAMISTSRAVRKYLKLSLDELY